ncbi:hypothetical protein FA95DRAFT_1630608 [Auriscalpium vulgare]|uniref:Uncharacterized protein n=1 Tax=Auriscalpium vulgare TaxID=40419 RepID=A0ACB8RHM8_9AGAM|nr:hypothetical protein FA95DRAFT_1630608 [Auriscalpium vulgare]
MASNSSDVTASAEEICRLGVDAVKGIERRLKNLPWGSGLLSQVSRLKAETVSDIVIGLFGSTGTGKSSLVNAVVETKLVPTSGMAACTATVVQVSYHADLNVEAEVSFISERDWRDEIETVVHALSEAATDKVQLSQIRESRSWLKCSEFQISAAYPSLTLQNAANMSVTEIFSLNPRLRAVLGCTKTVTAEDGVPFSQTIGNYITSYSPGRAQRQSTRRDGGSIWSIVQKVKIWCNAPVLRAGVTLVDLPGVSDNNDVRNSIAKDYISQCDHVFIMTDISRAVDDLVAARLVNNMISSQLESTDHKLLRVVLENKFAARAITVIATKSDSIDPSEILTQIPDLADNQNLRVIEERLESYEKEVETQKKVVDCSDVPGHEEDLKRLDADIHSLEEKLKTVGQKRPPSPTALTETPLKKIRVANSATSDEIIAKRSKIQASLIDKQTQYSEHSKWLLEAKNCSRDCLRRIDKSKELICAAQMEKKAFISMHRSQWVIDKLQNQFALKLELISEDGAEDLNLHVFSCSAREHHRLMNQDASQEAPECFRFVADTGIPKIQAWCRTLATRSRDEKAERFIQRLEILVDTIQQCLDHKPNGNSLDMTGVLGGTGRLEKIFDEMITAAVRKQKHAIKEGLSSAVDRAAVAAHNVSKGMTERFVRDNTIYWMTFRATLRRNGLFHHDFNEALSNPFLTKIAKPWALTLKDDKFACLEHDLVDAVDELLTKVALSAPATLNKLSLHSCRLRALKHAGVIATDIAREAHAALIKWQTSVAGGVVDTVQNELLPTYTFAAGLSGKGSYKAQRKHMTSFLRDKGSDVFGHAGKSVMKNLVKSVDIVGHDLRKSARQLAQNVEFELAIVWNDTRMEDDRLPEIVNSLQHQVQLWSQALKNRRIAG